MALKMSAIAGFALSWAAPGHAVEAAATSCVVPAPPTALRAELLRPYRRIVDAYVQCVDAKLAAMGGDAPTSNRSAKARRRVAVVERAAVLETFRRYELRLRP